MNLSEYRAIKDYSYIEMIIGDTYMKLDTTNSISFIYKDGNVYIKISSEVFNDEMIELHKDIILPNGEHNKKRTVIRVKLTEVFKRRFKKTAEELRDGLIDIDDICYDMFFEDDEEEYDVFEEEGDE